MFLGVIDMESDLKSTGKRVKFASSCIEVYSYILKEKLVSMGEIRDNYDLLVEFKSNYDMIDQMLDHILEKSDEIVEAVNECK